ncbi:MAG: hypothetical protein ACU0BK_01300 [Shimia sp.]|uniref:hypothetical protein n=1 Tax=Shimia sp. TaxID=1954381 RepID=UPI004059856D
MKANNYDRVLKAMSLCLIEIRASENLKKAQIYADVFHNVPGCIQSGRPEEEIIERALDIAERHKARQIFEKYF